MRATWSILAICLLIALSGATLAQGADAPEDPESEEAKACPCFDPGNWDSGAGSVWPALASGSGVTGCTSLPPSFQYSEGVGSEGSSVAATVGDATNPHGGVAVCQVYIDDPTFANPFEITGLTAEQATACVAALAAGCP